MSRLHVCLHSVRASGQLSMPVLCAEKTACGPEAATTCFALIHRLLPRQMLHVRHQRVRNASSSAATSPLKEAESLDTQSTVLNDSCTGGGPPP